MRKFRLLTSRGYHNSLLKSGETYPENFIGYSHEECIMIVKDYVNVFPEDWEEVLEDEETQSAFRGTLNERNEKNERIEFIIHKMNEQGVSYTDLSKHYYKHLG